jgi:flagellar FliL protein
MALEAEELEDELEDEEPEDDELEDEEEGEGKKRRFRLPKLNKFVLIGAAAAIVLVLGAAAYFLFFSGGDSPATDDPLVQAAYYYDLPPMTVNLSPEDDQELFLKLEIALELADEQVVSQIEPNLPRVLDAFQVYLRELRKSDLEGSAGIYQLKEELRRRVNLAIYPAEVQSILFREILVQ